MTDLSILIPARHEMFLRRTVEDILAHSEADTEIIVVLDGELADPPLPKDKRVQEVYLSTSIGQRAATNLAARMSQAKYVMKCDAHCAFDQGFDRIMLEDMQDHDDWTMVPLMRNLHAFDWVCANGHRRYQGPSGPCTQCGEPTTMDVVWIAKRSPQSTSMRFDRDLKFQYWSGYKKRQTGDLVETMSLLGACWLLTRERYWTLNICDEAHGSWGQQGTEVACKTWLSGGRLICDKRTWFAHMFRTQGGDFGFPYPLSGRDVEKARAYSRWLWNGNNWAPAIHPLSWLIEKFAPVPGWEDVAPQQAVTCSEVAPATEEITKGILYYTCNTHDPTIEMAARKQLLASRNGHELGCVSLKPTEYGDWQITLPLERSPLSMHKQILAGLERMTADVVFLVESDVLYQPGHFEFTPPRRDVFYYDTNVWKVRYPDGLAVWTDDLQQVSGVCAYRSLLLEFYRRRVAEIERDGFNRHYEPGPKTSQYEAQNWQAPLPNLDIRHNQTLTVSKWSPDEFRNARYAKGWRAADEVPGWGRTRDELPALLDRIATG